MIDLKANELTNGEFPVLNSLRACAILWVIIHHCPIPLPSLIESFRLRGDLGVELFFSISGFLVFRSLHHCFLKRVPQGNYDRWEFLKRRFFRILPPYLLTLGFIGAIALVDHGLYAKLVSIKDILPSFFLFYYNYAKTMTTGQIPGSLNIFWSLCFEEQFYFTLFLLSFFVPKKLPYFLFGGVFISIFLRLFYFFGNLTYAPFQLQMQTHLRMDALLMGCLIYYYWPRLKTYLRPSFFLLSLVIAGIVLHHRLSPAESGVNYILISLSFTLLVFVLISHPDYFFTRWLNQKVLTSIGLISYEIYLIHEIPVAIASKSPLKNYPVFFLVFVYGVSLAGAWVFHYTFSKPINEWLRKKYIQRVL